MVFRLGAFLKGLREITIGYTIHRPIYVFTLSGFDINVTSYEGNNLTS